MPEQPLKIDGTARRRAVSVTLWAAAVIAVACFAAYAVRSPSIVLLTSTARAAWLRPAVPLSPFVKRSESHTQFKATVVLPASPTRLLVTALRSAVVRWDGIELEADAPETKNWKQPSTYLLHRQSTDAPHRLQVDVTNTTGPALARIEFSPPLAQAAEWTCSLDGSPELPTANANQPERLTVADGLSPSPSQAIALWPLPVALLLVSAVVIRTGRRAIRPGTLRLLLIASWLLMAGIDLMNVPVDYGFDLVPHLNYLDFLLSHHRLPLGTEGWQLFQSPLFYLVAAPVWAVLKSVEGPDRAAVLLRVVPIVCGCAMIELVYRTLREVFPTRGDLQRVGLVVGGLLPVNLYMMQFPSNEPFMAVFGAAVAWSVCRGLAKPDFVRPWRAAAVTGFLLGAAVLSKVSAVIWVVPVMIAYAGPLLGRPKALRNVLACGGTLVAGIAVVAGWWFVRNQIEMGFPFLSHSGGSWWQDPGYRTPADLFGFGESLLHPLFTTARSVWDSVYSSFWADAFGSGVVDANVPPPWNLRVMLMTEWFALLPTGLMLFAGAVALVGRTDTSVAQRSTRFAAVSVLCFIAAVVYVYLTLPIYSCAKASYMMSATPCFAILIAAGFDRVPVRAKAFMRAILFTGAALGYATFVVTG